LHDGLWLHGICAIGYAGQCQLSMHNNFRTSLAFQHKYVGIMVFTCAFYAQGQHSQLLTANVASGIQMIKGKRNKSYCALDMAEEQNNQQTMLKQAIYWNDLI